LRVNCQREGKHAFKSVDVEQEVGKVLRAKGFETDYKKPKHVVYVDIVGDMCCIGILEKERLCRREYRVRINNQSINGCLAYAVVKIADIKRSDTVLDPLCKDGVIAIEAALSGAKKVYAFDVNKNNVRNALVNSKVAGVKIECKEHDLDWLDTLFKKGGIDKIVTNMFMARMAKDPERMVRDFFHQAEFVVKKDITLITNKVDVVKRFAMEKFVVVEERRVRRGDMAYSVLKVKKKV